MPDPKSPREASQLLSGVHNDPESFESDPDFQSNAHSEHPPFSADLLHRYFQNSGSRMSGVFTVREAAKRLGVCAATVYKLCATGALTHVRVMNSIRIPDECLQAFISSRAVERRP